MAEILPKPHTTGWMKTACGTTVQYIDLAQYAGRYVKPECENQDFYFAFGSATGFALVTATDSDPGTAGVVSTLYKDTSNEQFVIDPDKTWMAYRTKATASDGIIRIVPRSDAGLR